MEAGEAAEALDLERAQVKVHARISLSTVQWLRTTQHALELACEQLATPAEHPPDFRPISEDVGRWRKRCLDRAARPDPAVDVEHSDQDLLTAAEVRIADLEARLLRANRTTCEAAEETARAGFRNVHLLNRVHRAAQAVEELWGLQDLDPRTADEERTKALVLKVRQLLAVPVEETVDPVNFTPTPAEVDGARDLERVGRSPVPPGAVDLTEHYEPGRPCPCCGEI